MPVGISDVASQTSKPYYLDKNRVWAFYYNLLSNMVEKPKVLYMVRDLPSIFASMEKKFRMNPDKDDGTMDNVKMKGTTTHKRVELWAQSHPLGYSLEKLYRLCWMVQLPTFYLLDMKTYVVILIM